jgi:hypothetical protein
MVRRDSAERKGAFAQQTRSLREVSRAPGRRVGEAEPVRRHGIYSHDGLLSLCPAWKARRPSATTPPDAAELLVPALKLMAWSR